MQMRLYNILPDPVQNLYFKHCETAIISVLLKNLLIYSLEKSVVNVHKMVKLHCKYFLSEGVS